MDNYPEVDYDEINLNEEKKIPQGGKKGTQAK